jgi:hypothetical protein
MMVHSNSPKMQYKKVFHIRISVMVRVQKITEKFFSLATIDKSRGKICEISRQKRHLMSWSVGRRRQFILCKKFYSKGRATKIEKLWRKKVGAFWHGAHIYHRGSFSRGKSVSF